MKIRQRPEDFRVREILAPSYLKTRGEFRVYRVTKRKMTTLEAARALADELGLPLAEVAFAGLKDRQAVTLQYMSVPRGRKRSLKTPELKIEALGFANEPMGSENIEANGFEIAVRDLNATDVKRVRASMPVVREHGLINYFDDQRFGNLVHGQGWIARELMQGKPEKALRSLLASPSPRDDEHHRRFKSGLRANWGKWRACRDVAGRFGEHHSIFEHLARKPRDFRGAFTYVSSRIRLIHLYAYQSHLWNRAVSDRLRASLAFGERLSLECEEGMLNTFRSEPPAWLLETPCFRIPGVGLDDVEDPLQREAFEEVLAREKLVPDQYRIEGVSGFHLKGEERELVLRPRHLRARPAETDPTDRRRRMVRVRFELAPGSYATLVVKRLLAPPPGTQKPARGAKRDFKSKPAPRRGGKGAVQR